MTERILWKHGLEMMYIESKTAQTVPFTGMMYFIYSHAHNI